MGVGAGLTLDIATYNVDLDELRRAQPGDRVIGFVDVDHAVDGGEPLVLPPYPLIGLGSRHSPTGKSVDAVVEPPISAASLLRSVRATPAAAAVAAQVLRGIGSLSPQNGLVMESIAYGMLQAGAEHRAWLDRRSEVVDSDLERLVRFERNGSQLRVVLDRPLARNAIDRTMRDSLFEAFTLAALDNDISMMELRAAGPTFSIGGDLAEFGTTHDPVAAHAIRCRTLPAWPLIHRTGAFRVHVQGACIGAGLEIAAFADTLTAEPDAWFQLPELTMGLIPGAGGCVSVLRRIGRQRTALLILSGRRIGAATALKWGLIDAVECRSPVHPGSQNLNNG
jgi:enoyl-CoA hydratase/carnithine racemase